MIPPGCYVLANSFLTLKIQSLGLKVQLLLLGEIMRKFLVFSGPKLQEVIRFSGDKVTLEGLHHKTKKSFCNVEHEPSPVTQHSFLWSVDVGSELTLFLE